MTERLLQRWVVTGPIGAGKSAVVGALVELGAVAVDADAVGRAVLEEPGIPQRLAAELGPEVLSEGRVDRPAVARRVFADPDALARLNALTHPRLSARLSARLEALEAAAREPGLAVVEAAVYFLLPSFGPVDLVIAVTAPEDVRGRRLAGSGRLAADQIAARIAAQRPLLAAFDRADVVLDNDGDPSQLRRAVRALHAARYRARPVREEP